MRIDIHVHTSTYSPCGRSTPDEMIRRAMALGLDGLVLTEHNVLWPDDELERLRARYPGIRLFGGIEVTSEAGDHYLVYGTRDGACIRQGLPGEEIVRGVHARGGVVVLAHPYRYGPGVPAWLEEWPVDGIEICSNNMLNYAHERAVALCRRVGIRPVAASDGHHVDTVGLYGLRMHCAIETDRDLCGALLDGAYSLYADRERVTTINARLPELTAEVLRHIDEGHDDDEIHRQMGLGYTVIRGIRQGLDVARPGL